MSVGGDAEANRIFLRNLEDLHDKIIKLTITLEYSPWYRNHRTRSPNMIPDMQQAAAIMFLSGRRFIVET